MDDLKTNYMNKLIAFLLTFILLSSCANDSNSTLPTSGTNGSYSGIVIVDNFMYQVDTESIFTYDVTNPEEIEQIDRQVVGFLIESIFHMEGILFIGSGEALHIFEIGENGIPERKSQTNYTAFSEDQTPCDPVVSDGEHAFVTLSSVRSFEFDGPCPRTVLLNQLRIYDIEDLTNPIEVNVIEMINPKGLTYDGNYLFVCENEGGLKVFDKSNVMDLQLIHHFKGINTYDAIAKNGLLIVIGEGAIYQFDYTSITGMELISTLNL